MSCEYTVVITWVCFSYKLVINKQHTRDYYIVTIEIVVLLFVLQCLYSDSQV